MSISREELLRRIIEEENWSRRLIVEPFFVGRSAPVASASLDFHLGNRFTILRSRRAAQHDPLSEDPRKDVAFSEIFIPMGQALSLHPGQIVLGTTLEWFKFPSDLMAYVIGRSIWGRRGLLIVTAQAVHPGSSGTVTLEMSNLGEVSLRLKPGVAIGQLFFHQVESTVRLDERKSTFSGAFRPILGKYSKSESEDLFLSL